MRFVPKLLPLLAAAALGACSAQVRDPKNIETMSFSGTTPATATATSGATSGATAYQAQYRDPAPVNRRETSFLVTADLNARGCLPERGGSWGNGAGAGKGSNLHAAELRGELVSRGDLLDIRVVEDDTFTGNYEVSRDGVIRLPFLSDIGAQGRTTDAIETDLAAALIREGFYSETPRVSVRVMDFAAASVGVLGAVFEPRPVIIGGVAGDQVDRTRQDTLGASTQARDLANALRAAGGVRPDADLSAVELRRAGRVYKLDLREVITGRDRADIMLLTGDEVFVPSRECFQDHLMVPSPISPAGIKLFLSNLTQPATGNAISAIGRDVREVPYGTRYMQAAIDSNCVGGARATSGKRGAALYSRNPITKVSVVIERDLEGMMQRADRDDYDPYLLPGDALACYDSNVTNLAEIGKVMGLVLLGL